MTGRSLRTGVLVVVWLAAVMTGIFMLTRYKNTPGELGDTPATWPRTSAIVPASSAPTLVMFAHPKCPCTRASLHELGVLMSKVQAGTLGAHVVFMRPPDVDKAWSDSDYTRIASAIPGVTTSVDDKGVETARFGARTSGITLLYGTDGRLLYRGGLTSARGHEGENEGRTAILAHLRFGAPRGVAAAMPHDVKRDTAARVVAPVFGCSLKDPERAADRAGGGGGT